MRLEPATSSNLQTASAAISANPGRLMGLIVTGDGTNAATVTVYDNASAASGLILAKVILEAGLTSQELVVGEAGIAVNNGIYASLSGTGGNYIIYYTPS